MVKYILAPILLSTAWFFASNNIISFFNPDSAYKFLVYYQWIGDSSNLQELLLNILSHPLKIILHLLSFTNLAVVFVFLLTFAFLPIFTKRYWLLALGPAAQIFLSNGDVVYTTHYASLFLPALVISSIYGFKRFLEIIREKNKKPSSQGLGFRKLTTKNPLNLKEVYHALLKDKYFLIIIFIVTVVYANLSLGPTLGFFTETGNEQIKNKKVIYDSMIDKITDNASVVTSYNLLANLSNRQELYSLHYGFFGKRQFSEIDYIFPDNIDYYLIDFSDIITYQLQSQDNNYKEEQYKTGDLRLREYLKDYGIVDIIDSVVLFKKDYKSDIKLVEVLDIPNVIASEQNKSTVIARSELVTLLHYEQNKKDPLLSRQKLKDSTILNYSFHWFIQHHNGAGQAQDNLEKNYQLQLEILNKDGRQVWQKIYPLAYGIYPTSRWEEREIIKTNYWFLIPDEFLEEENELFISLVELNGYVSLNKLRSVVDFIEEKKFLREKIRLNFY